MILYCVEQNYLFNGGLIIPTSCIHFLHTLFSKKTAFDLKKWAYYMFTKQNNFYIAVISLECIPHRKSLDFCQGPNKLALCSLPYQSF